MYGPLVYLTDGSRTFPVVLPPATPPSFPRPVLAADVVRRIAPQLAPVSGGVALIQYNLDTLEQVKGQFTSASGPAMITPSAGLLA